MVIKLNENIMILNINENIRNILIDNTILTIRDLTKKTSKDLRNIGLEQKDIRDIDVQMQLNGYCLKNSL